MKEIAGNFVIAGVTGSFLTLKNKVFLTLLALLVLSSFSFAIRANTSSVWEQDLTINATAGIQYTNLTMVYTFENVSSNFWGLTETNARNFFVYYLNTSGNWALQNVWNATFQNQSQFLFFFTAPTVNGSYKLVLVPNSINNFDIGALNANSSFTFCNDDFLGSSVNATRWIGLYTSGKVDATTAWFQDAAFSTAYCDSRSINSTIFFRANIFGNATSDSSLAVRVGNSGANDAGNWFAGSGNAQRSGFDSGSVTNVTTVFSNSMRNFRVQQYATMFNSFYIDSFYGSNGQEWFPTLAGNTTGTSRNPAISTATSANLTIDWLVFAPAFENTTQVQGGEELFNTTTFQNSTVQLVTPVFETNTTNFTMYVNLSGSAFANVTFVALNWNGTNYSNANSQSNNSANFTFGKLLQIPLTGLNNSNITVFFWFYVNYTNGTNILYQSNSSTQVVLIAYNITSFTVSPTSLVIFQTLNATSLLIRQLNLNSSGRNTIIPFVSFNGSNQSMLFVTDTQATNNTLRAPSSGGTFTLYGWLNVTSPNGTIFRYSGTVNVTVSTYSLIANNGSCTVALNFTFQNEEYINERVLNGSMNATFTVWDIDRNTNSSFNFSFNGVSYAELCIVPNTANVSVDSFQIYTATQANQSYFPRNYFLWNATVDNITDSIALYFANASLAKLTDFTLLQSNGLALKNTFIHAQRYYPELNRYLTVAMVLTDDFGKGNTYLTPNDIFFRFVISSKQSRNLTVFSPLRIFCASNAFSCELRLQLTGGLGQYFDYVGKIGFSCAVSHVSNATTCTVVDTSGLFNNFTLTLTRIGLTQDTTLCRQNVATSSGTLVCNFNQSGYHTYVLFAGENVFLTSGSFDADNNLRALFGTSGLFLTFLIFIAMVGIASQSLAGGIFLGALSLVASAIFGFFIASPTVLGAVLVVALVIGSILGKRG